MLLCVCGISAVISAATFAYLVVIEGKTTDDYVLSGIVSYLIFNGAVAAFLFVATSRTTVWEEQFAMIQAENCDRTL